LQMDGQALWCGGEYCGILFCDFKATQFESLEAHMMNYWRTFERCGWQCIKKNCCHYRPKQINCSDCKSAFVSNKALQQHRADVHEVKIGLTQWCGGEYCGILFCSFKTNHFAAMQGHMKHFIKNFESKARLCGGDCGRETCDDELGHRARENWPIQTETRTMKRQRELEAEKEIGCELFQVKQELESEDDIIQETHEAEKENGFHWVSVPMPLIQPPIKAEQKEKPFDCSACKKSFPSYDALNKHNIDVHLAETFKCSRCNKAFFSNEALNRHSTQVPLGKPFKCSGCCKAFASNEALNRHNADVHLGKSPAILPRKKAAQKGKMLFKFKGTKQAKQFCKAGKQQESRKEVPP